MDLDARSLSGLPRVQPVARRIRSNSIWLLLARLTMQVQLVLFTVLVARYLGVSGFGQYAFVAALIFLGNVATTFGTDTLLIREVARRQPADDALVTAALWLQLMLSAAWLILVAISTGALSAQSTEVTAALKVYSLSLIPLAFYTVFTSVLRAHERMDLYLLLNLAVAFIQLGGAWWVLQARGTLLSLVMMLSVAQLFAAVLAGVLCYRSLPGFQLNVILARQQVLRIVRLAWPFALLGVLAVVYQRLGVLMVSTLGTDVQTGWYAAAARVIEPIKILHFAVLGALFPALAQRTTLAPVAAQVFRRSWLFLLISSVAAAAIIIALAPFIVMVLFGTSYAFAAPIAQILAVSLIPYTISASWSVRLVVQGRERPVLWSTAFALGAAFLLNRWLIPDLGSIGAALAVVGGETLLAVALLRVRH